MIKHLIVSFNWKRQEFLPTNERRIQKSSVIEKGKNSYQKMKERFKNHSKFLKVNVFIGLPIWKNTEPLTLYLNVMKPIITENKKRDNRKTILKYSFFWKKQYQTTFKWKLRSLHTVT